MQFYIDVKDFKVQPDKLQTMEELIFRTMIFFNGQQRFEQYSEANGNIIRGTEVI